MDGLFVPAFFRIVHNIIMHQRGRMHKLDGAGHGHQPSQLIVIEPPGEERESGADALTAAPDNVRKLLGKPRKFDVADGVQVRLDPLQVSLEIRLYHHLLH